MRSADSYYAALADGYEEKIRQLVPRYDDMLSCIVDLLALREPGRLLDIGAGVGNLAALLLERMPACRITALESSTEMVGAARALHRSTRDRIEILHRDVLDFSTEARFDAIYSNLVLHNLPEGDKARLLGAMIDWLKPDGVFIWGDLIRHSDERLQAHLVEYRRAFALAAGCPAELVRENFRKESWEDHPLTAERSLQLAGAAGFEPRSIVWAHDTFAIFHLQRAPC